MRLSRTALHLPPAPIRIVHLGLGAFHRAHQAWWTGAVDPDNEWGIAAFSGRGPTAARILAEQDGLFTLIERGVTRDAPSLVTSIVEAVDGARVDRLVELVASPQTAVVTLTVTEAGYRLFPSGAPNTDDPVMARDLAVLAEGGEPTSPLARLVTALDARRHHSGAPMTVVPCDNIAANGHFVSTGIAALAERRSSALAEWIASSISFASTSVDRITPRLAEADRGISERLTGWADAAPVVTEPFRDWVISGSFSAGRPAWERRGAVFVDDVEPFERRKLWLLNGAHSLLAYGGIVRGHRFVAEAVADEKCRTSMLQFWDEARRKLPFGTADLDEYCQSLLERFENGRMRHELAQIAVDGAAKLRLRVVPTARAELEAGREAIGCATALASWIAATRSGRAGADSEASAIDAAAGDVRELVAVLDRDLSEHSSFISTIHRQLDAVT